MNSLKKLSKFLSDQTSLFVILIAILAFVLPSTFSWVKGNTQTLILGLIMLTMGMTLSTKDFSILAQRPLDILIGSLAQYTIMPILAFSITKLLHLPTEIAIGLILVGCCPGGVSSNIMSFLCKGDVAFSVGMTTVSTLISPVLTPLLMLKLAGQSVNIDGLGMFVSIVQVTILPILLGFGFNYFFGEKDWFSDLRQVMPGVSVIGLALIVGGVIAAVGTSFFQSGLIIFIAIFCHNTLGYLAGYSVGKLFNMSMPKRRTISIEVGMQNAGLATNLASAHFAAYPMAAVAAAVSCVWHSISGTLLAGLYIQLDKRQTSRMCKMKSRSNQA
ncbi:bile acid:sodium symporter family protein [Gottschalkiaceae bacterium SANA]|nr:bile acid:sodium symporter family protein [Gottschalkiaceae bacterium SANA]